MIGLGSDKNYHLWMLEHFGTKKEENGQYGFIANTREQSDSEGLISWLLQWKNQQKAATKMIMQK